MFAIYWFAIHIVVHLAYVTYTIAALFIRPASHGGNIALIVISMLTGGFGIALAAANYLMAQTAPEHADGELLKMTYVLAGIGGVVAVGGVVHAVWMIALAIARLSKHPP